MMPHCRPMPRRPPTARTPPHRHRRRRGRAGRLRLARDGRRRAARTRSASPSCCPPARRSTSITCRASALADTLPRADRAARGRPRAGAAHGGAPHRLARARLRGFLQQAVRRGGRAQGAADRRRRARAARALRASGAALLRDGLLADCGVRQVGLAGYPEGHPRIATGDARRRRWPTSWRWRAAQGLGAYVVTQFSFAPNRIVEYCADLARRAPDVPVYVGLAGPTQPASRCCATPSAAGSAPRCARCRRRAWARCASSPTSIPSDQLAALARHARSGSASNVVGVHLYSFGGVAAHRRLDERAHHRAVWVAATGPRGRTSSPGTWSSWWSPWAWGGREPRQAPPSQAGRPWRWHRPARAPAGLRSAAGRRLRRPRRTGPHCAG